MDKVWVADVVVYESEDDQLSHHNESFLFPGEEPSEEEVEAAISVLEGRCTLRASRGEDGKADFMDVYELPLRRGISVSQTAALLD